MASQELQTLVFGQLEFQTNHVIGQVIDGMHAHRQQLDLDVGGLFGLGYMHSDLGGFAGGETFDKELYIRWLQYGVFQPVYRPHAQDGVPPEPVFQDRKTRNIVRDFIRLRYRLLPYNYTLAWENSTTGMPLMRPVFFEDESDIGLIDARDSYLWGDAFLVHPVTDPGVETVNVELPEGVWFDFWNGDRYEGETTASIDVDLDTIPVLVRGGSFVPMIDDIRTTADYSSENLTLHYYADESVPTASGQMYEDDGESRHQLPPAGSRSRAGRGLGEDLLGRGRIGHPESPCDGHLVQLLL